MAHPLRRWVGRLQVRFLRIEHVVFRPGDAREHHPGRQLLVVQPEPAHRLLDDGLLIAFVVDGEVTGQSLAAYAQGFNVAP